ncbi:MmyB family transcriptional regulator [Streptomyces sp. NPDC002676]
MDAVLAGHEPNPALAVDVRWQLLTANRAATAFLGDFPPRCARLPSLRATLHPDGLSRRIRNLGQWRGHVLRRLRRQLARTTAEGLAELPAEIESYPVPAGHAAEEPVNDLAVPLLLATDFGDLSLLCTTTVFGSPRDVTLDEIAIETFFPADSATAELLRAMAEVATQR